MQKKISLERLSFQVAMHIQVEKGNRAYISAECHLFHKNAAKNAFTSSHTFGRQKRDAIKKTVKF